MTRQNDFQQILYSKFLGFRLLAGAVIPVTLLNIFLLVKGIRYDDYVFVPMLTAAAGGALGAMSYHILNHICSRSGWNKGIAYAIGILIYILAVWVGLVGGLSVIGLWN